jgi:hypothetical protein
MKINYGAPGGSEKGSPPGGNQKPRKGKGK